MGGIKWGEDLERDCAELRKLEGWGIYPGGYHDQNCPLLHADEAVSDERGPIGTEGPSDAARPADRQRTSIDTEESK